MKRAMIALALACCMAQPASADEAPRLKVGNTISWPVQNVYDRDHFGCFDIENTKEAFRLYADAVRRVAGHVTDTGPFGAPAIDLFVQDHRSGPKKPYIFSDVCAPLPGGQKYKVISTFDWRGVGQLVCLGFTETFDPGPDRNADAAPSSEPPTCWWTALFIPPPLSRR
jgi:hypothetical protein